MEEAGRWPLAAGAATPLPRREVSVSEATLPAWARMPERHVEATAASGADRGRRRRRRSPTTIVRCRTASR